MKNLTIIIAVLALLMVSCKTKQQKQTTSVTPVVATDASTGSSNIVAKTKGKVSHEYRPQGCNTVVVLITDGSAEPLTLIPVKTLPAEFDKDGLTIYFNYLPSKMKNPEGCNVGIPAVLSEISFK
jgi:ABC-type enterochelin transport system substrate-binding protein